MDRSLTAARLARLLARLDPDADRGAEEYERLRRALVRFFDWRSAFAPDACADETIDRLARRLDDTAVDDVRTYALGIARHVLLESQRQPAVESLGGAVDIPEASAMDARTRDLHECFERCLAALPERDRSAIVAYYEGERSGRIAGRRRLAASLGLSDNALRLRMQRIRERIERCVHECLNT